MKVKLVSDFRDFYDPWFDRDGDTVFRRMTTDGMDRIQMLEWLKKNHFNPPPYGFVRDLWKDARKLVVYTDLRSHRGEGKLLLPSDQAFEQYPGGFASVYLEGPARTTRILKIGSMAFRLRYESDDKWRSNVGDVQITVEDIMTPPASLESFPLVAIDLVEGSDPDNPSAIDLNIAPGIQWTGVEDHLKGPEVVSLLSQSLEKEKA